MFRLLLYLWIAPSLLTAQVPTPYTVFLNEPVPAKGEEIMFNPPVLRWPYVKGKDVTYEVWLSQDSSFTSESTIKRTGLTGALYNPHQLLANGRWYWRYRVAGGSWSDVLSFDVKGDEVPLHSPGPQEFLARIPPNHPRVLKESPDQDLQGYADRPEALTIRSEAEKALAVDIRLEALTTRVPPRELTSQQQERIVKDAIVRLGHQVHDAVVALCQAYLLTSDPRFKNKAVELAMMVSEWDPEGPTAEVDFTDGACMLVTALVLDTFYEELNPEQQQKLVNASAFRAERFYRQWVNNIESKVLSGHVWQLILNEFFKTSLALYGHEPRAGKWLEYAYELFLGRTPVLGGVGGGWAEGASYFTMNMEMLVEIPEKIRAYTGFDFINVHPWYRNQADWLIYQVPPGGSPDGFGDNTEDLRQPPPAYAAYARVMETLLREPRFTWYYRKIEELQKFSWAEEPVLRWFRLLHCSGEPLPTNDLTFSMGKHFPVAGIGSLHTNPSDPRRDIFVALRASPFGAYGHAHADQNTFNVILDGERLFFRTGYKVAMNDPHRLGWSMHTKGHNGVLINGEGQPYSIDAGGEIRSMMEGEDFAYLLGDASNAYRSRQKGTDAGLTRFYRHLLLLKPGVLILYDELEAREPVAWTWLIHSLENMSVDSTAGTFKAWVKSGSGLGKLWSSEPLSWTLKNQFDVPAVSYRSRSGRVYRDDQWHLAATTRERKPAARFLAVIRITRDGSEVLAMHEDNMSQGCISLQVDKWKVTASLDASSPAKLEIASSDGRVIFALDPQRGKNPDN